MMKEYREEEKLLLKQQETAFQRDKTAEYNFREIAFDVASFNIVSKVVLQKLIEKIEIDKEKNAVVFYSFKE